MEASAVNAARLAWSVHNSVQVYISVATLTLTIWDCLLNIGREVQLVWSGRSTWIKRLYFLARYFGIVALAVDLLLVVCLANHAPTAGLCKSRFLFQLITSRVVISALEVILSLRVYAIYNMDRTIGIILLSVYIAGSVLTLWCGTRLIMGLEYDHKCNAVSKSYFDAFLLVICAVARYSIIWFLTLRKQRIAREEPWGESPILRLLCKDASWVLVGLAAMIIAILPYVFVFKVVVHAIFLWPLALASIYACHLILTTLNLGIQNQSANDPLMSTMSFRGISVY